MARDSGKVSEKSRVWKRVALVAAAGAMFGFAASVWLETPKTQPIAQVESSSLRQTSIIVVPAESANVKPTADTSAEVQRLKTRNRRLEALVQVLQQRAQAGKRDPDLKIKN